MPRKFSGFYVSFSGESSSPITNIYAVSPTGAVISENVLAGGGYDELRGLAFGPDGNLYVAQAHQANSLILQFAGAPASGGSGLKLMGHFATPTASSGLMHPYQPIFDSNGNLYVSCQDTNVVTAFYGPNSATPGKAMPLSIFLQRKFEKVAPDGKPKHDPLFNLGTFTAAFSAKSGVPPFTPIKPEEGGLTSTTVAGTDAVEDDAADAAGKKKKPSAHSVRGLAFDDKGYLYVADEGADRVAVFDTDGNFLGAITKSKHHTLSSPVALCFDGSRTLYIGSPGNNTIFTYDVSGVTNKEFGAKVLSSGWPLNTGYLSILCGFAVRS
jgi:DNA-binding beta-propeller fold protein YncE